MRARLSSAGDATAETVRQLRDDGFAILPGPGPAPELARLAAAYDRAVAAAEPEDVSDGGATTRVHDLVNRGAAFDAIYVHAPLLEACCRLLGQPFELSTMHARYMVDEFRPENGATRFVRGSQGLPELPAGVAASPVRGPAGSLIVFNGSVWHGHGANETGEPRRSIQGAFIRRGERPWTDLRARMQPETFGRISPLAKCILAV